MKNHGEPVRKSSGGRRAVTTLNPADYSGEETETYSGGIFGASFTGNSAVATGDINAPGDINDLQLSGKEASYNAIQLV